MLAPNMASANVHMGSFEHMPSMKGMRALAGLCTGAHLPLLLRVLAELLPTGRLLRHFHWYLLFAPCGGAARASTAQDWCAGCDHSCLIELSFSRTQR